MHFANVSRMLLFMLLSIAITVSFLSYIKHSTSKRIIEQHLVQEVRLAAQTFVAGLSTRIDSVVLMLDPFVGMDSINTMLVDREEERRQAEFSRLSGVPEDLSKDFMDEAGLVDATGTIITHTVAAQMGSNISERSYIRESLSDERCSMAMAGLLSNSILTCIAVPVRADEEEVGVESCREHAAASRNVNISMTEMDAIAHETAETMHEASRSIDDFAMQSGVLNTVIEGMKKA